MQFHKVCYPLYGHYHLKMGNVTMEITNWHTFILLVWILQLILTTNGIVHIAERCGNETEQLEIHLNCSGGGIIHVESEVFGKQGNSCHVIGDNCRQVRENSDRQLEVNCNGHQSCDEVVKTSNVKRDLTDYAVEVSFSCVTESINMCTQVNGRMVAGSVYLHSPGFPDSVGVSESCNCSIIGTNMTVTLVEYNMTQGSLDISSDGIQIWPNHQLPRQLYNTKLKEYAASVVLLYKNDNHLDENVWIKIRGASSLNVTCSTLQGTTTKVSTYITSTQTSRNVTVKRSDLTTENQHTDFSDSANGTTSIQDNSVQEITSLITDFISTTPTGSSVIKSTTVSIDDTFFTAEIIAALAAAGGVIVILFGISVCVICRWKRKRNTDQKITKQRVNATSTYKMDSLNNMLNVNRNKTEFTPRDHGNYIDARHGNQEEGMVVNDLYHGYTPPSVDPYGSSNLSNESLEGEDGVYSVRQDNQEEVMVINDLYHTYRPSGTLEEEQTSYHHPGEDDQHPYMVDNDLYQSHGCGD